MSIAELDALRAAYVDAEEWMLEGVCASLDALRGDRASVRETLVSFLGALPTEEAVDALADLWAPRGTDGARGDASGDVHGERIDERDARRGRFAGERRRAERRGVLGVGGGESELEESGQSAGERDARGAFRGEEIERKV